MSAALPPLPPGAEAQITASLAAILLGYTFACTFYGCGTVQAFIYFRVSPRDGPLLKAAVRAARRVAGCGLMCGQVALIWLLDTLHTALLGAAMYTVVVKDWSNVLALASSTWTLSVRAAVIACGLYGVVLTRALCARRGPFS
jgi:hypothetical protein